MGKLKIVKEQKGNNTVTRTIRISGATFDKISELSENNVKTKPLKMRCSIK